MERNLVSFADHVRDPGAVLNEKRKRQWGFAVTCLLSICFLLNLQLQHNDVLDLTHLSALIFDLQAII